jgi:hypothetical protein
VYEDGIMKYTESCGKIGFRGITERVLEGVNLIKIEYMCVKHHSEAPLNH